MLISPRVTALLTTACSMQLPMPVLRRGLVVASTNPLPPHLLDMIDELKSGEAQLFDVREPQEAAMGKLALSKLVPLSELQEGLKPRGGNPGLLTYLHCAAGVRVHPASAVLQAMGYERVVPLQEGFATLYSLGFELE